MPTSNLDPAGVLKSPDGATSPVAFGLSGRDQIDLRLSVSEETFNALEDLALASRSNLGDVISKAFVLYQAAAAADRQGKAVGIAPTADALETHFVGF